MTSKPVLPITVPAYVDQSLMNRMCSELVGVSFGTVPFGVEKYFLPHESDPVQLTKDEKHGWDTTEWPDEWDDEADGIISSGYSEEDQARQARDLIACHILMSWRLNFEKSIIGGADHDVMYYAFDQTTIHPRSPAGIFLRTRGIHFSDEYDCWAKYV